MTPQFVYVAIYSHKHGEDVAVYESEASAWKWADEIAQDYWDTWYDEPMPSENVGREYFNGMNRVFGDEWYTVERRQVEP